VPDQSNRTIPLNATRGKIVWSVRGPNSLGLLGRSEQVDLVKGTSSSYACFMCCPNSFRSSRIEPLSLSFPVGEVSNFRGVERDRTCYGAMVPEYYMGDTWAVDNTGVVTISGFEDSADVTAVGAGSANVIGHWDVYTYTFQHNLDGPYCDTASEVTEPTAPVDIAPHIDSISPAASAVGHPVTVNFSGKGFASGASISPGTGVTVSEITVSSATSMSATLSIASDATAGNRDVTVTVNGKMSNSKTFTVQIPDRLRVVFDTGNFGLVNCPTVVGRLITYQVSDSSTDHLAIAQAISVEEAFDNQTSNSCVPGQPDPSPCAPADDSGQFRDGITMTDTCNSTVVANCNANPSCGYQHTQRWLTCFPEAIIELMSAPGITHCNQIKVNNSTQLGIGTLMPK